MKHLKTLVALALALVMLAPASLFAASHREAPITALDRGADITDWYTFISPNNPNKVVMILNVDPLLEPANGPNYFPFDPNIVYAMHVDNNNDGVAEDVNFEFRFTTETRLPGVFTGFVGNLAGIPAITKLDGPGSEGLSLRQHYSVTMIKNGVATDLTAGKTLFAVPSNVGAKTMPNYNSLFNQGIYDLGNGVRVFAGTVNDPFYIDLGGFFDSVNFRMAAGGGVLSAAQDADDTHNYAPDAVAGYNVNTIVIEVPSTMLTVDGKLHSAGEKQAVIGTYGTTSRPAVQVRRTQGADSNDFAQVQRMGNPLINEVIIGTGFKDKFSTDEPENDAQFADFVLHPLLADILKSIGVPVPSGDRTDLLPLVLYMPPICPGCGPNDRGAIADLLRLNTGIPQTPWDNMKRLGVLAGDFGGFPNGRRPVDDVTDIATRVVAGILVDPVKFGTRLGDGVNTDGDNLGFKNMFPFVKPALSGRDSHHVGPGQKGCTGIKGGTCPKK